MGHPGPLSIFLSPRMPPPPATHAPGGDVTGSDAAAAAPRLLQVRDAPPPSLDRLTTNHQSSLKRRQCAEARYWDGDLPAAAGQYRLPRM